MGKIYYREVIMNNELLGIEELKDALSLLENRNNSEKEEVEIYIKFLKIDKIL